ncbi:hypothetical protein [Acinetobacter sp. YK3]|uniref:hypothetical protein n=1 Tax=Acinetobacter sp. YK3 TaxID=1860097 RepID=UPI0009D77799|nr:hypothetical protein [Acinetobacter sp. YK3]
MGYIIKLIDSNNYLVPSEDGWLTTTSSRDEAVKYGVINSFEEADETVQNYSNGMRRGVDYVIESSKRSKYNIIQITLPLEKAPNLKGIEKFIKDGKATVFLTNTTSSVDALNGITRFGLTTGNNAFMLPESSMEKFNPLITEYLNERFGNDWKIDLLSV